MNLYFNVISCQNMKYLTEEVHNYNYLRYQTHSDCFPLMNDVTFSVEVLLIFSFLAEFKMCHAQFSFHNIYQKLLMDLQKEDHCRPVVKDQELLNKFIEETLL